MWGKIVLILLIFGLILTLSIPPNSTPDSELNGSLSHMVYADEQCTDKLTTLDWGICGRNQTVTRTCWLRNEGNTTITTLISVTDYTPPEAHMLNFTTNLPSNESLTVGQVIPLTFTITIPLNVTFTTFTFNIWINMTSAEE